MLAALSLAYGYILNKWIQEKLTSSEMSSEPFATTVSTLIDQEMSGSHITIDRLQPLVSRNRFTSKLRFIDFTV
ncbi:hypothetical protein L596_005323 [Steinernema carpocapsae]|uniref:Uncharacterized protein n=1 Tax=Steinernema carpocapsae TaxID=34508 RepID=A0A4U8V039_STECR|nr:hypothetical protein L596_005323 [Steinernema carpocapsae]